MSEWLENMNEVYKKIDRYEERILSFVGLSRKDYRKGSLKQQPIHYLDFGNISNPCILLIHGYGGSGVTFYKILPELIKNFRVIYIDLLGFGKSDRPDFDFEHFEPSLNFFIISLVSLINYLRLKRIILVGHSFGGLIAGHLARLIPQRIIAVFLVSPAGFVDRNISRDEEELLIKKVAKSFDLDEEIMQFITFLTFDKKVPVFNYIKPTWLNSYIENFFHNKRLNLDRAESAAFIKYYKIIYHLKPCGFHSLWTLFKVGGYCQYPLIDVIRENPDITFFVYYGDDDWLDWRSALEACQKSNIHKNFHLLKDTNHQVFFQNPKAFLEQFYLDYNKLYRNDPSLFSD